MTASTSIETRQDLVDWALSLLPDPFKCPDYVGATYGRDVRQLEWGTRPLWTVFALMAGGDLADRRVATRVQPFLDYLRAGLTPGDPYEFAAPVQANRQVAVEMQSLAFGLIACGESLLGLLGDAQRERLVSWLNGINDLELPWGAWYMYRVFVNAALKSLGLRFDAERLAADAKAVEAMYAGNGWYEDGTPFQRDYHIPLAFHVLPLLLERFTGESPIADVTGRARLFAADFAYWFDDSGRSLPFGRSQVYRFAHASFWAALALADDDARAAGKVKSLLLGNLSWWRDRLKGQPRGLTLGYGYPNIMVGEDYSGPGAPLLALQTFCILALPASDAFWQIDPVQPKLEVQRPEVQPGMLFYQGGRHAYALSAMQYSTRSILQRMSKYGKFCYSTAFGWNVSRDVQGIGNFALDSALALSIAGTEQFVSRSRILGSRVEAGFAYSLWAYGDVARVETWLVPVDEFRHVRVHRVDAAYPLDTYEGGFPVFGWDFRRDLRAGSYGAVRIWRAGEDEASCQVSGIADAVARGEQIRAALIEAGLNSLAGELDSAVERDAETVRQNPDTNIYDGRQNAVPALHASLDPGEHLLSCLVYGNPGADARRHG